MGKGTTFSTDLLKLIFNATAIANIADNASSSPLTTLQIALHTADPHTTAGAGTVDTQNASEATYTSYARVAINRNSAGAGWAVPSAGSTSPQANIDFAASTGSPSETETYASVGITSSGATKMLYSGTITPNITVNAAGIIARLTTASTVTEA